MKETNMIFGIHAVLEALKNNKDIDRILIRHELSSELARELFLNLKGREIPIQRVPMEKLNRITRKNHQGVIAFVSEIEYQRLEDILPFVYEQGRNPFIILLDGLTDVRNFGAIARTCECAAVDAIVIPAKGSATVTPDAIKTSAGALLSIPVCKEKTITHALNLLRNSGVKIIAATEHAADLYTTQPIADEPVAIILGAEDTGIAQENIRLADHLVRIPLYGKIESLNVSVAASILIYETVRRRNK
jgi:23S rRNA (guanosine2251-2'-O)-methyltransferase